MAPLIIARHFSYPSIKACAARRKAYVPPLTCVVCGTSRRQRATRSDARATPFAGLWLWV